MRLATIALALTALPVADFATTAQAAPSAPTQERKAKKGYHMDTRFGFQFKEPRKWNRIAVKTEEQWLAAKYRSDKSYFYTDKELGWTFEHNPEFMLIAFPTEVMKKRGKQVEEKEDEGGVKATIITFTNPYKSYDDFLDRTYSGGGFYKSEEEEDEIDGVKVTKLVYNVEKLARSGPKRIITWIYHTDEVDYALQTEVLADSWSKVKRDVNNLYKSFELIERDGPITHDGSTSDGLSFLRWELSEGTPKEQRSKRMKSEKVMHEKAIAKLPPEWEHKKKDRVMLLSHADKSWSDKVLAHTNGMLEWLDETLGFIAEDQYIRAPIVRVCRDREELSSYAAGVNAGGWGFTSVDQELVTCKDDTGWGGRQVDQLNWQIYRYWITEKNDRFASALPQWIDNGLEEFLERARMDSRKPDFRRDEWTIEDFKEAQRGGRLADPRDLMKMTDKAFFGEGGEGIWDRWAQSAMLVSFLLSDDSKRCRQARGLFEAYCRNLLAVMEEVEKESESEFKSTDKKAKDEDEEKKLADKLRSIWKKKEEMLLERTFERTFKDWSEKDWEQFTKAFHESVG